MVNQCCCGCSLRTGTLILLWLSVILGVYVPISNLEELSNFDVKYDNRGIGPTDKQLIKTHLILSTIISINGLTAAIIGINAIHKNKAKSLTPFLYYYYVETTYYVFFMFVALVHPKVVLCIMPMPSETSHVYDKDYAIFGILCLLLALAFAGYFITVIQSCRDSMLENPAGNNARAATNSNASPSYWDEP